MLQHLSRLERLARMRRDTDRRLVNWWLYTFVLSWITFGIYPLVMLYRRLKRRDDHFERIKNFYEAMIICTEEYAQTAKRENANLYHQLEEIKRMIAEAEARWLKPRGATAWIVAMVVLVLIGVFAPDVYPLTFVIGLGIGLYLFYVLLFDWQKLERFELDVMDRFNQCWAIVGLTQYPIQINTALKKRSPVLYVFLLIITLGFFAFYWDYCIHYDPERLFRESEIWEDSVVSMFRNSQYLHQQTITN